MKSANEVEGYDILDDGLKSSVNHQVVNNNLVEGFVMSEKKNTLWMNKSGTIEVTDTMVSWPGTHVPVRNISAVRLRVGFPVEQLEKLKKASYVVGALGLFGLIGGEPNLLVLGILMFLWYWFCPCWIEINAGGVRPEIVNKSTVRKSGGGQREMLEAINTAIMKMQDK